MLRQQDHIVSGMQYIPCLRRTQPGDGFVLSLRNADELQTATVTSLADLHVYLDKYHWKVGSEGVRSVKYVVELMFQAKAEHVALVLAMPTLDQVANDYPCKERGFYPRGYDSHFQEAVEKAMANVGLRCGE